MTSAQEHALCFRSAGHELAGILHLPARVCNVGLIMIPAGAQYRVGPHRQHVLIARALAERGIATLRYDSSGTADSCGPYRDFELGPDMDGAVNALLANAPGIEHVVLWGICGSASAILMHEGRSSVVRGMILVNPWIRSEQSQSRAYLKHYYADRVLRPEFWRKLLSGRLDVGSAIRAFVGTVRSAVRPTRRAATTAEQVGVREPPTAASAIEERMARGLRSFEGHILLIMSEKDLTAREFDEFTRTSKRWRRLMKSKSIDRRDLLRSDHVFSQPEWRAQVIDWMSEWLLALPCDAAAPFSPAKAPTGGSPRTSAESRHG